MEKVILELNHQQFSIVSDALINLPYRVAAPIIDELNRQIIEQQATTEALKSETSPVDNAAKE